MDALDPPALSASEVVLQLPELVALVLWHLGPRDLLRAAGVCRLWHLEAQRLGLRLNAQFSGALFASMRVPDCARWRADLWNVCLPMYQRPWNPRSMCEPGSMADETLGRRLDTDDQRNDPNDDEQANNAQPPPWPPWMLAQLDFPGARKIEPRAGDTPLLPPPPPLAASPPPATVQSLALQEGMCMGSSLGRLLCRTVSERLRVHHVRFLRPLPSLTADGGPVGEQPVAAASPFPPFTRAATVEVYHCRDFTSVAGLGSVPSQTSLRVIRCTELKSVAGLGPYTRHAHFETCLRLQDLTALSNVQEVVLAFCSGVTDASLWQLVGGAPADEESAPAGEEAADTADRQRLSRQRTVSLSSQSSAGGAPRCRIRRLTLNSLPEVQSVGMLGCIPELDIRSCDSLTSSGLVGLEHVDTLTLAFCEGITSIANLGGVRRLSLRLLDIDSLQGLGAATGNEEVSLAMLVAIGDSDLAPLAGVRKIALKDISAITTLAALRPASGPQTTESVRLEFCKNLRSLEGLEGVSSVNLRFLESLSSLSPIQDCPNLTIQSCRGLGR